MRDQLLLAKKTVKIEVDQRLQQFRDFATHPKEKWFSELCFCLLTSNSKATTAMAIQDKIGYEGFVGLSEEQLAQTIREHKHRFHNTKAHYIVEARKFLDIKNIVTASDEVLSTRQWLAENIKGLGYKEASHFLRNVGYDGVAILDRHILNLLVEHEFLDEKPSLTPKNYIKIEQLFCQLAKDVSCTPVELDVYMWYMKTGKVLK